MPIRAPSASAWEFVRMGCFAQAPTRLRLGLGLDGISRYDAFSIIHCLSLVCCQETFARAAMRIAVTCLFVLASSVSAAAQCIDDWRPLGSVAGFDGTVYAMTQWDPDGDGPEAEWLVFGGSFSVAGDRLASAVVG